MGNADSVLRDILKSRGWAAREGQLAMNSHIWDTIQLADETGVSQDCAVSAPVGTGKSLAELLPGIVAGKRMIVATSTKRLQDQLVNDELPKLKQELKELYDYDLDYAILKGRANYACICKVDKVLDGDVDDEDSEDVAFLFEDEIEELQTSEITDRDLEILNEIKERFIEAKASREPMLFDTENLLGQLTPFVRRKVLANNCPSRNLEWVDAHGNPAEDSEARDTIPNFMASNHSCLYGAAYAHAVNAQVVVVNTTLMVFEMLRIMNPIMEGKPSVLVNRDVVVVDEAHHLARILAEAFSVEVSLDRLLVEAKTLSKRLSGRYIEEKKRFGSIVKDTETLIEEIQGIFEERQYERIDEDDFRVSLKESLTNYTKKAYAFVVGVIEFAAREEDVNPSGLRLARNGAPRAVSSAMYGFSEELSPLFDLGANSTVKIYGKNEDGSRDEEVYSYAHHIGEPNRDEDDRIIPEIKSVPIDVSFWRAAANNITSQSGMYSHRFGSHATTFALTSGTITANTPLTVGMQADRYLEVDSPFDVDRARVYVPTNIDAKRNAAGWAHEVVNELADAIEVFGGRTLVLSTSNKMVEEITNGLVRELPNMTILSQSGTGMTQTQILDAFREAEGVNTVIVGTRLFWEGIDLPGKQLSLVAVDRAMIPPPNDPVFSAMSTWVERQGRNAFMEVSCDFAAIMLAQGWGRLIRHVNDAGGLMLLDSRIVDDGWGKGVTKLIPRGIKITRDQDAFLDWAEWVVNDKRDERNEMPEPNPRYWKPLRPERRVSSGRTTRRSIPKGSAKVK